MRQVSLFCGIALLFVGLGLVVWAGYTNKSRLYLAQGLTIIELGIGAICAAAMRDGPARTVIVWLGAVAVAGLIIVQLKMLRLKTKKTA